MVFTSKDVLHAKLLLCKLDRLPDDFQRDPVIHAKRAHGESLYEVIKADGLSLGFVNVTTAHAGPPSEGKNQLRTVATGILAYRAASETEYTPRPLSAASTKLIMRRGPFHSSIIFGFVPPSLRENLKSTSKLARPSRCGPQPTTSRRMTPSRDTAPCPTVALLLPPFRFFSFLS